MPTNDDHKLSDLYESVQPIKEHHDEYPEEIQNMTVGQLLIQLERGNPELYHKVEEYLDFLLSN